MRDAVALEGQLIEIDGEIHTIKTFYFVPGTNYIYVGLTTPQKSQVNYSLEKLLPYIIKQTKL